MCDTLSRRCIRRSRRKLAQVTRTRTSPRPVTTTLTLTPGPFTRQSLGLVTVTVTVTVPHPDMASHCVHTPQICDYEALFRMRHANSVSRETDLPYKENIGG